MSMAVANAKPACDPVADALSRAPLGDPFPPEVLAQIQQAEADLAAGRGVRHEDVPAWLEARALDAD